MYLRQNYSMFGSIPECTQKLRFETFFPPSMGIGDFNVPPHLIHHSLLFLGYFMPTIDHNGIVTTYKVDIEK